MAFLIYLAGLGASPGWLVLKTETFFQAVPLFG